MSRAGKRPVERSGYCGENWELWRKETLLKMSEAAACSTRERRAQQPIKTQPNPHTKAYWFGPSTKGARAARHLWVPPKIHHLVKCLRTKYWLIGSNTCERMQSWVKSNRFLIYCPHIGEIRLLWSKSLGSKPLQASQGRNPGSESRVHSTPKRFIF